MKRKSKTTREEKMFGIIGLMMVVVLYIVLACALQPTNFNDKNKFNIEPYYVEKGDCAWNIYKKTCSNYDWYDWGEFVKNINGISNLSNLQAGDVIEIPIPIK